MRAATPAVLQLLHEAPSLQSWGLSLRSAASAAGTSCVPNFGSQSRAEHPAALAAAAAAGAQVGDVHLRHALAAGPCRPHLLDERGRRGGLGEAHVGHECDRDRGGRRLLRRWQSLGEFVAAGAVHTVRAG